MNGKPTPGPRPAQGTPLRPTRPQYAVPTTPTDARAALQQSLDRRW
jgi:hypothetical protein